MLESVKERWNAYVDDHPRLEKVVMLLRNWLPPLNYITIHYAYFLGVTFASSLIYWGSSSTFNAVDYVDSLFLVTSAITNTGLNTRNLSETTTWQQVQLWFLLMIGSPIWVSFWTVLVRKHAFERRFDDIVQRERQRRKEAAEKRRASGIRRAPNLRNMIAFRKHNTDPNGPPIGLSGLGPRMRADRVILDPISDPSTQLPDLESGPKRTISAPHATLHPDLNDAASESKTIVSGPSNADSTQELSTLRDHITFAEPISPRHVENDTSAYRPGHHLASVNGRRGSNATSLSSDDSDDPFVHWRNFLGKHNVSRNGQFYDLNSDQREKIGGCEYRALKILAVIVPLYSALWQFLGAVALACWIATRAPEIPRADGENPWWAGIFYSVSAFNNGGFSLVDDSLIPFQSHYFVLIVVGLLILAGNTAYPVFLRLILWSILKILNLTTDPGEMRDWKETFEFILKYPRRVYTTLFPSRATWWLVGVLFVTNVIDWLAFEILNIGNPAVAELPIGDQIMAGLFQAISVRAAGFVVIGIPSLYIGVQVLYLIMMYIAVYPVVITMRSSNVYEERSLGIYEDDLSVKEQQEQDQDAAEKDGDPKKTHFLRRRKTAAAIGKQIRRATTFQGVGVRAPSKSEEEAASPISFVSQQIKGQLAHDLWWLVLAIIVIVIIETDHFLTDPVTFSVFNILFEATSAYACVGLSIGLPTQSYSFSGGLHRGSKLVLCLVMMRGRHRGLPVAIDRAVRLPGEHLIKEEEEDSRIRRSKTMHRMVSRDE